MVDPSVLSHGDALRLIKPFEFRLAAGGTRIPIGVGPSYIFELEANTIVYFDRIPDVEEPDKYVDVWWASNGLKIFLRLPVDNLVFEARYTKGD